MKDIELKFVGETNEPLYLGGLEGNKFKIVIRDVDEAVVAKNNFLVPNDFDSQRFSKNNLAVGKALLEKNYRKAVEEIISTDEDYKKLLEEHLSKSTNDYVGALRSLPKKSLIFYVHSVQSQIFNQILAEEVKKEEHFVLKTYFGDLVFPVNSLENSKNNYLDLVGFDADIEMLTKHKMNVNMFINRQIPEISLEGGKRKRFAEVKNCFVSELEDDELNKGRKKYTISNLKQVLFLDDKPQYVL